MSQWCLSLNSPSPLQQVLSCNSCTSLVQHRHMLLFLEAAATAELAQLYSSVMAWTAMRRQQCQAGSASDFCVFCLAKMAYPHQLCAGRLASTRLLLCRYSYFCLKCDCKGKFCPVAAIYQRCGVSQLVTCVMHRRWCINKTLYLPD